MRLLPMLRKTETLPSIVWPESRFFDDFFGDWPFGSALIDRETWSPRVDILEEDNNLILRAELPGVKEKEIDLKLEGNVLTLKGERKNESKVDRNHYHRKESFHGVFSRSFTLPETVNVDEIKADFKDGLLTVTLPQRPEAKPREIPVSVN